MSAVYKRLEREDTFITPYTAHKTFSFTSASFDEVGIQVLGAVSGTFPYSEKELRYAMVSNHFSSSDSFILNEFEGIPTFPDTFNVLSIPRNLYGRKIKPGSLTFYLSGSGDVYDDNSFLIDSASGTKIGYINYSSGLLAFTGSGYEDEYAFYSSSFVSSSFLHTQKVYAAVTQSIVLDPQVDPNPFQPGASDPTEMVVFQSASHDFSTEYIYGTPDSSAVFPTAPYLAPRLTLTIGAVSASYFAQLIDDTTTGQLTLDFNQNLAHPITGPVNLSNGGEYSQFDSIEIEWKKDARNGDEVTHVFLASGSWSSSLYDYPQSSSNFTILDEYKAEVDPVTLTAIGTYPADLTNVEEVRVEFSSASVDFSYFTGSCSASFQATEDLQTYNYHCHVDPNEFNYTHNPSVVTAGTSGSLEGFATGSDFRPYATTVGIYNSSNELLAVGKLGQATPILPNTPYTFVVQLDL